MRHPSLCLLLLPLIVLAFACGPVTDEASVLTRTTLALTAEQGNDLVYSTNSNVVLHLFVNEPANSNAVQGNLMVKSSRGSDTLTPADAAAPGDGEMRILLHVTDAGTATITASLASLTATLDIEVSAPDPSRTTLVFEPATVVAGEQAALATLWAKDSQGRSISGVAVAATTDDPNMRILPSTVVSHAGGRAVFSVLGYRAGAHTVNVTGEGLSFNQALTITAAGIHELSSSVTFTPATSRANGIDKTMVLVQVRDAYNNPIVGRPIKLTPSSSSSVMGITSGVTDGSGNFVSDLSCTEAKVVSVLAEVNPVSSSPVGVRGATLFTAP